MSNIQDSPASSFSDIYAATPTEPQIAHPYQNAYQPKPQGEPPKDDYALSDDSDRQEADCQSDAWVERSGVIATNSGKRKWSQQHGVSPESRQMNMSAQRQEKNGPRAGSYEPQKRLRYAEGQSPKEPKQLSDAIWQRVFRFLPPTALGRFLSVSRRFNALLSSGSERISSVGTDTGVDRYGKLVGYQCSDQIWAASRKRFSPWLPRPLRSATELESWKLILGTRCQFCQKEGPANLGSARDPFELGPGHHGVRIIWPFGVRCCGSCLETNSQKEMDFLLSSAPSFLIPALSFAYLTPTLDVVFSVTLRSGPPSQVQLTKCFLKSHIDDLLREFEEVRMMGSATAEEWIKGLEGEGQDRMAAASRWEQWELSGGAKALPQLRSAPSNIASTNPVNRATTTVPPIAHIPNMRSPRRPGSSHQKPQGYHDHHASQDSHFHSSGPNAHAPEASNPPRPLSPQYQGYPPTPTTATVHPRGDRSLREVKEAKAIRRAEIERRCLEMVPPLPVHLLVHMDSFNASMQIPHPFSQRDWDVLKPRLLSQREIAEQREQELQSKIQATRIVSEERAAETRGRDAADKEVDELQQPVKDRLARYADDFIQEHTKDGSAVTKETCPDFAAELLMSVRYRFYAELAQEEIVARAVGQYNANDTNRFPVRKLTLENMKWVYDTKIKPITEQYLKELFVCNGCDNNPKFYGFEGVVQHYAAKHTNLLSLGSVIVHWKAEWPEKPPFRKDPTATRSRLLSASTPAQSYPPAMYMPGQEQNRGVPLDGSYPQPSPGQYPRTLHGPPNNQQINSYADPNYPGYQQGSYHIPSPAMPNSYPAQGPYGYHTPQPTYPTLHGQQPPAPQSMYGSPYPAQAYPTAPATSVQSSPMYSHPQMHQQQARGHPPEHGFPTPKSMPARSRQRHRQSEDTSGLRRSQLAEISEVACMNWDATAGFEDLLPSVRLHVMIYYVFTSYKRKFGKEPELSLVAEAMSTSGQLRSIANVDKLPCKACVRSVNEFGSYRMTPSGPSKLFTLIELLHHFESAHPQHINGKDVPLLDWKIDMLELPEPEMVRDLMYKPGMTDRLLRLIAPAFPNLFPKPLPRLDAPPPPPRTDSVDGQEFDRYMQGSAESPVQHELEFKVDGFPSYVDSPGIEPARPLDPPREDEYDPHQPAFVPQGRTDRTRQYNARPQRPDAGQRSYRQPAFDASPRDERAELYDRLGPEHHSQRTSSTAITPLVSSTTLNSGPREQSRLRYSEAESIDSHIPGRRSIDERISSNSEALGAAERFLQTVKVGLGPYQADLQKSRISHEELAWREDERRRRLADENASSQGWNQDGAVGGTAESSAKGTPSHLHAPAGWQNLNPNERSSAIGVDRDYAQSREQVSAGVHREYSTEAPETYNGRRYYQEAAAGSGPRRPNSRFDRYEAQRHESTQPMTRSPPREQAPPEQTYIRERSPSGRPIQRTIYTRHPDAYAADPADEPIIYRRSSPVPASYQYVEQRHYIDPYDPAYEYVRVAAREPTTYYIERPARQVREYVDFEDDSLPQQQQQPLYEQERQYVRAEPRIPKAPEQPGAGARQAGARYR